MRLLIFAGVTVSRSSMLPSVGLTASGSNQKTDYDAATKREVPDVKSLSGGIEVSWEIDLSGRLRAGAEAAAADAITAEHGVRGASLPWEYPQRAVEELERCCAKGAVGVMVLANAAGKSLTDSMFAPIWAAIDKRALPVLVHPTDPPGVYMMDMSKFDLSWSVGFMFDTTLAITRMIFEGFFDQYPNMKVIAAHGGGTLPYLVGRFEKGDEVELASRRQMKRKPTDYLRHIYYDSITYDVRSLKYLIEIVGSERVMFGTDWPHWVHDTKGAFANTAQLPEGQMKAVRSLDL
jgi:aminocarboxymuconate-semialdehyde decarboxylase